ncbi:MAG TPA: hypothetical protein VFT69_09695 [Pseudolabrys sp.]|nr:hypothetical protein [Pseudolabrys sp.]
MTATTATTIGWADHVAPGMAVASTATVSIAPEIVLLRRDDVHRIPPLMPALLAPFLALLMPELPALLAPFVPEAPVLLPPLTPEVPAVPTKVAFEIVPAVIKATVSIVVIPVAPHREAHDGESDLHGVFRQEDTPSAVDEIEVPRRHPAALAAPTHVAPRVARKASMNVDPGAGRQGVDHRETRAWARAEIQIGGDETRPRHRGGRGGESRSRRDGGHYQITSHLYVPVGLMGLDGKR